MTGQVMQAAALIRAHRPGGGIGQVVADAGLGWLTRPGGTSRPGRHLPPQGPPKPQRPAQPVNKSATARYGRLLVTGHDGAINT
jgi:hypothetical protein